MNFHSFKCRLGFVACLCFAALFASAASESDCRRLYDQVDQAIVRSGVRDAQETIVKGYPYLRSNRFLASVVTQADSDERFDFLLRQMAALDQRARRLELSNLPPSTRATLELAKDDLVPGETDLSTALEQCANTLLSVDNTQPNAIKAKVVTASRYSVFKRLLGFYPISAVPFSRGIRKFQAQMKQIYGRNLNEVIRDTDVIFHVPAPTERVDIAAILRDSSDNPLRIPMPNADRLAQLFAQFAPNFAIDTRGDFDRPGAIKWGDDGRSHVDPSSPTIYTLASHTQFEGQTLLQLNFAIWFSERPKKGKLDMLGGALDGLIWRVTLAPDGAPLLYDSIHPCGCHHLFFPSDRLRALPPHRSLQEVAYVPQLAPRLSPGERPTIWVESATHYIVRITNDVAHSGAPYELADNDQLRSLPNSDGSRRSLFRPDGLIEGTERGERWFFWPMGIANAGAMRQWGHHATAFVGMRHFDDANLIEKAFVSANSK